MDIEKYKVLCTGELNKIIRIVDLEMQDKRLYKISENPYIYTSSKTNDIRILFITYLDQSKIATETLKNIISLLEMENHNNIAYVFLSSPFNHEYEVKKIKDLGIKNDALIVINLPSNNYIFTISRGIIIFNARIKVEEAFITLPWYATDTLELINELNRALKNRWPTHQYYPTLPGSAPPDLLTVFLLGEKYYGLKLVNVESKEFYTTNVVEVDILASYTPLMSTEKIIEEVEKEVEDIMKKWKAEYKFNIKYLQPPVKSNISISRLNMIKEVSKKIFGYEAYFDWYPNPNPSYTLSKFGYREFIIFGPGEFRYPYKWDCKSVEETKIYSKFYDKIVERE